MYVPIALAVGTLLGVAITKTIESFKRIAPKPKKDD
jgi:hypothetical protein